MRYLLLLLTLSGCTVIETSTGVYTRNSFINIEDCVQPTLSDLPGET